MADHDILARLSSFIDYESPELAEFLYGMWSDQANAITYHELRDAIMDGSLSLDYLRDWQQDYSKFIVEAYTPVAEKAIAQAAADLRAEYGVDFHDPMAEKVDAFIRDHGGQLIRQVSTEQYTAVNALVRQASMTTTMTVDQLARAIRPCVGLTRRQAQTTKHFYDSLIEDGYSHKTAYKRQLVYAAKIHRRRAALIAQTEMAYAYSAGWHATVQQNVEDGILPPDTKKVWLTAEDEKVCDVCGAMNGETVLWNEPFSNGSSFPPAHPNCRCHHKIDFVNLLTQIEETPDQYANEDTKLIEEELDETLEGETDESEASAEHTGDSSYMSNPYADERVDAEPIQHTQEEYIELTQYAAERGIRVYDINRFDGDSSMFKEQVDAIAETREEFNLRGKIGIRFGSLDDPSDLACTNKRGNTVTFSNIYLRDKQVTNRFLSADNHLATNDSKGISYHEMGHVIVKKYGNIGLDVATEAYYNLYGTRLTRVELLDYLSDNVSIYSALCPEKWANKPFKKRYFKEVIPEILSKDKTNPTPFTSEFMQILKRRCGL